MSEDRPFDGMFYADNEGNVTVELNEVGLQRVRDLLLPAMVQFGSTMDDAGMARRMAERAEGGWSKEDVELDLMLNFVSSEDHRVDFAELPQGNVKVATDWCVDNLHLHT